MRARGRVVAVAAMLVLPACGDQTGPAGGGGATPRGIAAVVIDHVDLEPNRVRGSYSRYGYPTEIEAEVDYGVDPEGTEEGETLTVVASLARQDELPQRDRQWLSCVPEDRSFGGCENLPAEGGTFFFAWYDGQPEEDPGGASYIHVHDGIVVRVSLSGPFIDGDPRGQALGVDFDQLREVALDPRLTFEMDGATLEAGRALDNYRGAEAPPEKPDRFATPPEMLAARVVRYAEMQPTLARPSSLDAFGPDAVGAHLEFPARGKWAAATVDILTVAGRPPMMDPMPCGDTNNGDPLPPGETCFGLAEEHVVTWEKAHDGKPGKIWILGYQQDEEYLREESVGVLITTPDLTFDLYQEEYVDIPFWWLAGVGNIVGDLSIGPETSDPTAFQRVRNWRD